MRQSNAGDWSFLDSILGMGKDLGVYTVPGDGVVDYAAVFEALKGYSGWVASRSGAGPRRRRPLYPTRRRASPISALRSKKQP